MKRLAQILILATFVTLPFLASAQQRGGAGNLNGWQLPAASNIVEIGDGRESKYSGSTGAADALADIAADVYGWGVPTGGVGSIVLMRDHRLLVTEQLTIPPGVIWESAVNGILLANVTSSPGVVLSEGSGLKGFIWGVSGGPGNPYVKVDLHGADGTELPTFIIDNKDGGIFSAATDAILIVGGHADSEVRIEAIKTKTAATKADVHLANTFQGTVRINDSHFDGDLLGDAVAGGFGVGVGLYASTFNDVTLNGKIDTLADFFGGRASTLTFGAVANVNRSFGMIVGTLTDNSTAGTLNNDFSDAISDNGPPASQTVAGVAEIATSAEINTGTDDTRVISPLGLAGASPTLTGISVPGAGADSERFGASALSAGSKAVAVGKGANSGGTESVAVGRSASSGGASSVAIGYATASSQSDATAVGRAANAGAAGVTALGSAATGTGANSTAVGFGASTSTYTTALAIGRGATATGNNDGRIGSATFPVNLTVHGTLAADTLSGTNTGDEVDMVGDSGSGGTAGLVPAPGAGDAAAGKFLKADATWAVVPGSTGHIDSISMQGANFPYIEITNGSYTTVARYVYRGSSSVAAISNIKAIGHLGGGTDYDVRVYDVTNALVIAELIDQTNGSPAVIDLGTVSNIPAAVALWEIQILATGAGSKGRISSVQFRY